MFKTKTKLKPINAPVYSYWNALALSFYSMRLYIDVGKRWSGYGIRYLMVLIALWCIPFSIKMGIDFNEIFEQQLIEPLSIIPNIYIQNGQASFDKPMPYFIKNKKNEVVLIIDTTGTITDFDKKYPHLSVLINKDKVAFRTPGLPIWGTTNEGINNNRPIIQYFKRDDNLIFSGKNIVSQGFFTQWRIIIQCLIYPVVFSIFLGLFLLMFLTFGLLGQLFSRIFFSFSLPLTTSCRLLMVSSTPMMLLLLLLLLFNRTFPGFGFLLVVALGVYFYFAVYSLKSESKRMVNV